MLEETFSKISQTWIWLDMLATSTGRFQSRIHLFFNEYLYVKNLRDRLNLSRETDDLRICTVIEQKYFALEHKFLRTPLRQKSFLFTGLLRNTLTLCLKMELAFFL